MRKAKKKLHRMPKLSLLDQIVYWSGLILLCATYFALSFIPVILRNRIAFSDDAVVAVSEHASVIWAVLPCLTFFMVTFIPWTVFYGDRRPILFMKNKPYVWVSERKQKEKKHTILILVILLLISFIPFPWSIYGRDCLMADGSIRQYSMFNNRKDDFSIQEIDNVEFSTYTYFTGKYNRTIHWDVQVTLEVASGAKYTFQSKDFRRDPGSRFWMTEMLRLKSLFDPSIILYRQTEDLKQVVWDCELSNEEELLLYRLFDLEPNL